MRTALFLLAVGLQALSAGAEPVWQGTIVTDAGTAGLVTVLPTACHHGRTPSEGCGRRLRCRGPACPAARGTYSEDRNGPVPTTIIGSLDFPLGSDAKGRLDVACGFVEPIRTGALICTHHARFTCYCYANGTEMPCEAGTIALVARGCPVSTTPEDIP